MTGSLATLPQIAEQVGVEYRTLQSWVEKGAVVPYARSTGAGYASLYGPEQAQRIASLVALRRLGLSLPCAVVALAHPDRFRARVEAALEPSVAPTAGFYETEREA